MLESDSFLTLSFQKRLVPLHKNAGKFDIVYCTPIYFYRYDNYQAVFRLEGLRVLTFTDCDNFVCFKVAIDNWVMPLFWEQEEENFRLETLRRLEEKRRVSGADERMRHRHAHTNGGEGWARWRTKGRIWN